MIDQEFIKQWCRDRSYFEKELLFVKKLREKLTDEQVVHVLQVVDGICRYCWDADEDCQCWNDE